MKATTLEKIERLAGIDAENYRLRQELISAYRAIFRLVKDADDRRWIENRIQELASPAGAACE